MVLHKETDAMARESGERESECKSVLIVVLMVVPDP